MARKHPEVMLTLAAAVSTSRGEKKGAAVAPAAAAAPSPASAAPPVAPSPATPPSVTPTPPADHGATTAAGSGPNLPTSSGSPPLPPQKPPDPPSSQPQPIHAAVGAAAAREPTAPAAAMSPETGPPGVLLPSAAAVTMSRVLGSSKPHVAAAGAERPEAAAAQVQPPSSSDAGGPRIAIVEWFKCAARGDVGSMRVMRLTGVVPGGNVDVIDSDGYSALHIACLRGQVAAVQTLLELGANVNLPNTKFGAFPLHLAAHVGKCFISSLRRP